MELVNTSLKYNEWVCDRARSGETEMIVETSQKNDSLLEFPPSHPTDANPLVKKLYSNKSAIELTPL